MQSISQIQERVISLLRSYETGIRRPLNLIVEDTCSEVSRLVACWILSDFPNVKTSIAKGEGVHDKKEHDRDVLLIEDENIFIIDPTVWQIFPEKQSIFVRKTKSVEEALLVLEKNYSGTWIISETITLAGYVPEEQKKLEDVIKGIVRYDESGK
jgi:hypothetical protein